jgi:hypothetical protein
LDTLIECKNIWVSLGGANAHEIQCKNIPENCDGKEYFFHRQCYQKFTLAKALLKRKVDKEGDGGESRIKVTRTSTKPSLESSHPRGIFPDMCMICKKKTLKVNQKSQHLTKIVTKTAENTLKQAASIRNDTEMLIEVGETDLIAK